MTRTRPSGLVALSLALIVAAGVLTWAGARPEVQGRTLRATPASLTAVFASARGGETVMLAPGDYGVFTGGVKRGRVTVRSERPGAARMGLALARAANVTFDGLAIDRALLSGPTHDVTITRSVFSGPIVIRADAMTHARIVLEHSRLPGIDVCAGCYEGRVHVLGGSGRRSGIVIRANVLGPGGNADGIQNSGDGVTIARNTFVGIVQSPAPGSPHTDALQLYGQRRTIVRSNTFRNVSTAIMAPDGGDHERIEDNVLATSGYPYAIMLGGDDGSIIRHNTLSGPEHCAYGLACGTILIGDGPTGRPSRGTVVRDNVLGQLSLAGGSVLRAQDHNLIAAAGGGSADWQGYATYAPGHAPGASDDVRLAPGSVGAGAASDGGDVGGAGAQGPGRVAR